MKGKHTFRCTLLTVRLHSNVRIEMVQRAISLLTAVPSTLIHALDFFVASSRTLVLLGARDGYKRVNLRQMMLSTISSSPKRKEMDKLL